MGNICRSPTAEAVFRGLLAKAGLDNVIHCDSAGTHDYHIGEAPDERSIAAGRRRGYDLASLRARQVGVADFARFSYVLAMDRQNLAALKCLQPNQSTARLMLYGDMHNHYAGQDVPDPYYGGVAGFERVLDMAEAISVSLLETIRADAN